MYKNIKTKGKMALCHPSLALLPLYKDPQDHPII
jgi:hypothetical protein